MLGAMEANRAASVETVVEADPVAEAVRTIFDDHKAAGKWEGTATALLEAINWKAPTEVKNARGWPQRRCTAVGPVTSRRARAASSRGGYSAADARRPGW